MIKVKELTELQKDLLIGQTFDNVQFFNPVLDADGKWFISIEEYNYLTLVRANEIGVINFVNPGAKDTEYIVSRMKVFGMENKNWEFVDIKDINIFEVICSVHRP